MAQAFRHLRAIQPFGDVKAKKLDQDQDEQEAVQGDKVKFDPTKPFIVYRWYNMNWYDSNGKPLIDDDTMQFSRKTLNTL
jgi:protein tyrosine phosphatase